MTADRHNARVGSILGLFCVVPLSKPLYCAIIKPIFLKKIRRKKIRPQICPFQPLDLSNSNPRTDGPQQNKCGQPSLSIIESLAVEAPSQKAPE